MNRISVYLEWDDIYHFISLIFGGGKNENAKNQ